MGKLPWFLRIFVSIKFLLLLLVVLMVIATLGVALNFQITGEILNYVAESKVLSLEAISKLQDFALQDNAHARWFTLCTALGTLLSAYGFFTVVQIHTHNGQGEGGKKLIYLGLLVIFFAGAVDSVMGYKGAIPLMNGVEVSQVTLADGSDRELPFKLKVTGINVAEAGSVMMELTEEGREVKQLSLQPWRQLAVGVHNMSYYGIQQTLPLITFHAKSLRNLVQEPTLIGMQVNQRIANNQDKVAFQVLRLNAGGTAIVSNGTKIEGFENDGRSVDYVLQYEDKILGLRTFEKYPHLMAVNNGKGVYSLFPFGLSPSNKVGWDVLDEYMKSEGRATATDKEAFVAGLSAMGRYDESVKPLVTKQVVLAASVIDTLKLPYMLQMDQVHPLLQVTLNVHYEPAIFIGYAGLLTLIAGVFVVVAFARRRRD